MEIFDIYVLLLLSVVFATTINAGCVCKDILASNVNSTSGMYPVFTASGYTIEVYCEMGLNGGGYTFLTPDSLTKISDTELSSWFTDRTTFLFRVRTIYGTQPYAVLQQLPEYSGIDLKLGLSEYTDYNVPYNIYDGKLDELFLYFGFLPAEVMTSASYPGIMVNSQSYTYENCDQNPNSHIVLFPNFKELQPSTFRHHGPFCDEVFGNLLENPSQRVMPPEMFFFGEAHWGGCGCYEQTNQIQGITGFNIGFK